MCRTLAALLSDADIGCVAFNSNLRWREELMKDNGRRDNSADVEVVNTIFAIKHVVLGMYSYICHICKNTVHFDVTLMYCSLLRYRNKHNLIRSTDTLSLVYDSAQL